MKAATLKTYGAPDSFTLETVHAPSCGPEQILVQVYASMVTQGDRRIRAADYPTGMGLLGRLMMGLFRPKHAIQGTNFAGRVLAVGEGVTGFVVGDDIFGSCDYGAYGEQLLVPADSAIAHIPHGFTYEQAAALPYGAMTAYTFVIELGQVKAGEKVLVLGASGGVGRYAVQLAKHLGAEVTAVASARTAHVARAAGADHVVDYREVDALTTGQTYDVIFDTADVATFRKATPALTARGRFMTLFMGLTVALQMLLTGRSEGKKAIFAVVVGKGPDDMATIAGLLASGAITPMIDRSFPLEQIADAHAYLESGHATGEVIVEVTPRTSLRVAA